MIPQSLVGTKQANPIATLAASVQMLHHLGLDYHANVINYGIDRTVNYDKIHTPGAIDFQDNFHKMFRPTPFTVELPINSKKQRFCNLRCDQFVVYTAKLFVAFKMAYSCCLA